MRVIAGKYRGRLLRPPKGADMRITLDNVKGALFNILGASVEGVALLDIFAGSGSLGIEALSRGAGDVTFVDSNPKCVKAIEENIASLVAGELGGVKIMRLDAIRAPSVFYKRKKKFDIILADPPYYKGIGKKILQAIAGCDIVTAGGLVVVEHYKKDVLPERVDSLNCTRVQAYGDTVLSFYRASQNSFSP